MKHAILLAALALGACQQSEEAAPAASDTATAVATEAAATGPPRRPAPPPSPRASRRRRRSWSAPGAEGTACELPITFAAGGKITDGPFDSWTIEDDQLVMGGEIKLKLSVVDQDTMESLADGSTEKRTLKRCA
jgi:pyruvate/2-oxoglutarate dehydrogenase complex dihydrolipoamide acyltransferase (E2) component